MRSPRLLVLAAAVLCVSAQSPRLPPALDAAQGSANNTALDTPSTLTDTASILDTASAVNQNQGAPTDDTPPGLPKAPPMVTALDGQIGLSNIPNSNSNSDSTGAGRRDVSDYEQVFAGTAGNDAPVVGTAYFTYILVTNSSYEDGKAQCLATCTNTKGCVFVNLYYELGNPLIDSVYPEKSNLKCVLFGDVHTAEEKADYWNRQLSVQPNETTISIQNSSGYALATMDSELAAPDGYELVFGPISAANNAPGYMGFALLTEYSVDACAQMCNTRGPDPNTGACKYFNIWRAVNGSKPKTYTCAMYSEPTDASTADNTGQGSLHVTLSRGYKRISYIADGDFEQYTCPNNADFCFDTRAPGWTGTSPADGNDDATIFDFAPYAHMGTSVGLLGSAFGRDSYIGTLTATVVGDLLPEREYAVQFFYSSTYSGKESETPAFFEVLWNGEVVGPRANIGYSAWTSFAITVEAVGGGNDTLAIRGGGAPAYVFIDDVYLFLFE
ncbi:hypothetical protein K438DRAFT_1953502 [Mycena galopus ATCC 62051]|nr:hypothetical protein K438DRAFT_1953502 [Mycena galopus ATCC 62051]